MNKQFLTIALSSILFFGVNSIAHEGHDEIPGQIKAQHGGIVKAGKEINMEMLVSGDSIQFFPLAHSGEDLKIADVKLTGTAKTPKGKPQALTFTNDGKAFATKVDLKGAYRADLDIKAQHSGKTDSFKFLLEK
ncbi:hypothetical protein B9G69_010310 [Bdellovibrio sp. SKB1291214]|uniref:hypothetical protein n=1 Tax=unclassified Bdellovibrio TaxID=2633795 RepID=UPI000B51981F|nr:MULTISPECIES: hypothetical protein [unclassified Bdellovibrio]QDK44640.1 hypothetical protein DOM22_05425 [Bdellovibrio sp. ZAP7]UYL07438.1 hypothetical protein B9G69_010310 [Bdellovibrio sp. SKB1291214]